MATATSTDQEFPVDPFADFNHQLIGHLSGTRYPNGNRNLLSLCSIISQLDESTALQIVRNVAQLYNVDVSAATTSRAALEILAPD